VDGNAIELSPLTTAVSPTEFSKAPAESEPESAYKATLTLQLPVDLICIEVIYPFATAVYLVIVR
jgi:hypothetical protein